MQREKIRPSFAELQKDFEQSDGSDSDDGVPEYAPAATPFRGVPPPVVARSSSTTKNKASEDASTSALRKPPSQPKAVRIAPASSTQVREIESRSNQSFPACRTAERSRRSNPVDGPESFRFTLGEEHGSTRDGATEEASQRPAPLIGTIQERIGLNCSTSSKSANRKGLSKFAQSKQEEKSSGDTKSNDFSHEEWLDEDGEPMSTFRKRRLIEQGKGPPAVARKSAIAVKHVQEPSLKENAGWNALDPLMQAISRENEAKVSAMSAQEMEESLQELSDIFGLEMLEKLKRRKEGKKKAAEGETGHKTSLPAKNSSRREISQEDLTQEEMRARYFSNEPEELPSALKWTTELEEVDGHSDKRPKLRFDFSGQLLEEGAQTYEETHLAGLHHHGDEQNRAGYSVEELLHLARSTLPSQCAIALQTLERIFTRYNLQRDSEVDTKEAQVSRSLMEEKARGKAAVIACWYIEDRQVGVRSVAMRCLDVCSLGDILQALSLLPKGQEKAALNLINIILPTKGDLTLSPHLFTLSPFFNEMLRIASHHQVNIDDETVDPLSGIELWQSASTGLPLRPDWPFIALDDLLHSGNCASLNRKNALSSKWDANERQIVVASLELGLQMWDRVLQHSPAYTSLLPSSGEVHLAIIKVFMLEEDQSQGGKATGLITGRDLFRDDNVGSLLAGLFQLAQKLDQSPHSEKDDLEKVATRHFGSSLPFYQLYTNFLGLYDSISFGMELFGRAILLAQSNEYAPDYRRLLWIDYGHCLATIKTTLLESPFADIKCFLCSDVKDVGILQAMVNVLMRRTITRECNELLFHMAVQQIGHAIWYSDSDKREKLAEAVFGAEAGRADVQSAIEQYGLHATVDDQEQRKTRREWVDKISRLK